ncbi:hypothetical protein [Streptomyces sp. H27-C3]|uniref:hypothetical protein n=1 Tax=Streptomyces sp. H27-C3 TaxID=3046305 RepID=UPI0024BBC683|nr:hypothetical protein [Streptomyces sp. H27-C3]
MIDLLLLAILLSVWRRPQMSHPVPHHVGRKIVTDLVTNVVVFGATIPIAFVSPAAAMWSWLSLVPIKRVLFQSRRARTDADADEPQPSGGRNAPDRAKPRALEQVVRSRRLVLRPPGVLPLSPRPRRTINGRTYGHDCHPHP